MMGMPRNRSEYWIVTAYQFAEHARLDHANAEAERLREQCPNKTFTVIRCKRNLKPSPEKAALGKQVSELVGVLREFPGFTDDATKGDAWVEKMRAAVAKATGAP